MPKGEILFRAGIALIIAAAALAIAAAILFHVSKRRLNARLEKEYGARRKGRST